MGPVPAEPGYTTTEFWLALAVSVIGLLTVFGVIHLASAQVNAIMGALELIVPNAIYAISRGIRKAGTSA